MVRARTGARGVALTFECFELGYTFDPPSGARVSRTEAARGVRGYARDVSGRLSYAILGILPQNATSRASPERRARAPAGRMAVVGLTWDRTVWPLRDRRRGSAPSWHHE